MALVKCPSCGRDVSTKAASCPQCGHQFKDVGVVGGINLRDPVHFVGLVIAGLVILGILFGLILVLRT
jgi:predicted amidophosphoribosyltransferase